ncbi:MAG: hypothetical protein CMJ65_14845 [Planctomycetaceae bacterium]|nr:hypothetical protein [Planctomycetaceae bacterium]
MLEWLLKSIGVADELVENVSDTHVAFQRPLWLYALILMIPAAWFIYVRQRENLATVRKGFRIALTATRVFILVMLILVLASPVLRLTQDIDKKPILAVLFDASQSMQLPAGPFETEEQRLTVARAAGFAAADEGALDAEVRETINGYGRVQLAQAAVRVAKPEVFDKLTEKYDVQYFAFARRLADLGVFSDDPESKTITVDQPNASYLGDAVLSVLDQASGQRVSGLVVFSDGQNPGGASPADAASAAVSYRKDGAPIFTVPVGSTSEIQDVAIVDVYTPGMVAIKDTIRVHVTIESHGFEGKPVKVQLVSHTRAAETVLAEKELVLSGTEQQQVELTHVAETVGPQYLEVRVPEQPGESKQLRANNHDIAYVRVNEEKLKVLLLDGRARWDFRFLKNALRRDTGVAGRLSEDDPEVLLEAEWRRQPAKVQAEAFPRTIEEIGEYDVIILGDVSPELLTREREDLLIRAVQEQGVGLIVEAGTEHMPHAYGPDFQELLPVVVKEGVAGREAKVFEPFRMEVSADGSLHETMRLYDDPGRNQVVWSRMPPYYWCAAVERPAAGATVLAWNPSIRLPQGKLPLISWQFAGKGKVMFVATDSTWLWRRTVGDRFFYKFWGQSLRFMAPRDDEAGKKSWIEVQPVRVQPGEEARIEMMAFADAEGTPREDLTLPVIINGPGGSKTVQLERDKKRRGRFTGRFLPEEAGKHSVSFMPPGGDETQGAEALLNVMVAPEEFRQPQLNRATLQGLAQATGGKLLELDRLASLPPLLKGQAMKTRRQDQATIWDNWLMLVLLVLVYSIDVGIRRLMGLS